MTRQLSKQRLNPAHQLLDGYVRDGKLPGYACLISQGGEEVAYLSAGYRDIERQRPIERDTLYRIYSMTKPLTSIAMMQLYERGLFLLDDPVAQHIPAWQALKVFDQGSAEQYTVREPERAVTIKDLLTHTAGFTYSFQRGHPLDEIYRQQGLDQVIPGSTLEAMINRLTDLPLQFSPGQRWNYSIATDIVGYLVQQLSGQSLDDYFQANILDPLGMNDTGFSVAASETERFAACYHAVNSANTANGSAGNAGFVLGDNPANSVYLKPPTFLSGGGGLVSTVDDYHNFACALLGHGAFNGQRIIGRHTLDYMTCNHLKGGSDLAGMGQPTFSETNYNGVGFGLGFAVVLDPTQSNVIANPGEFSWGGMASTYFWVDPVDEIIVVFMTQLIPSSTYQVRNQLKAAVYGALC